MHSDVDGSEEVTGLKAFEDLDPVSTVSALNQMPEDPGPVRAFPPPARGGVGERAVPPPPRRAANPDSLPPPPTAGARADAPVSGPQQGSRAPSSPPRPGALASVRSAPPPVPGAPSSASPKPPPHVSTLATTPEAKTGQGELDEDTKVVPNEFAEDPYFADTQNTWPAGSASRGHEASDDELLSERAHATGGRRAIDDTELLERSATTVATGLDMDWEDEELETRLREDGPAAYELESGRPSPFGRGSLSAGGLPSSFPPAPAHGRDSSVPGNPSPFAPLPSQPPPSSPSWSPPASTDWEEDAATRVMMPSPVPAAPQPRSGPFAPAPAAPAEAVQWPEAKPGRSRQLAIGLAVVAAVAMALGARALLGGPDTGTVTLLTTPTDAEVAVDGRPLLGQTSPFTVQGLSAGVEHHIEVRKEGFEPHEMRFSLEGGEVRSLEPVTLVSDSRETGFTLDSRPSGAAVYVDGEPLSQTTPVRIVDLPPGLHSIRVEHDGGYQPWQTQVELSQGQMIELPAALLVASSAGTGRESAREARAQDNAGEDEARARREARQERRARRAERRSERSSSRVAAAPSSGGARGTLRINSRPWSQVFVDGRLIGNTPQLNIALPPGRHNVKLVNPQMNMSKRFNVSVKPGATVTKVVTLSE